MSPEWRAGAQDVIIAEHTQRIPASSTAGTPRKSSRRVIRRASRVAEKLGGLTATVTNLALGVDRLERRLDGGSPSRQAGQ